MDYTWDKRVVGTRLKMLRKKRGYKSQDALADALGYADRKTVSRWETGAVAIPTEALIELCNFLSCDIDYLLGRIPDVRKEMTDVREATGLSSEAVERLIKWRENDMLCFSESLDSLLTARHFEDVLIAVEECRYFCGTFSEGASPESLKVAMEYNSKVRQETEDRFGVLPAVVIKTSYRAHVREKMDKVLSEIESRAKPVEE